MASASPPEAETAVRPDAGEEAVAPAATDLASSTGAENSWPDESAESAFLAEQREQGEGAPVAPLPTRATIVDEADAKTPLPALNDLIKKIPAETRELMDELFRAKFVAVRRVPKEALK